MSINAAIFDMDGVLVDSEKHWHIIEHSFCGELGVASKQVEPKDLIGKSLSDITRVFQKYNPSITFEEVYRFYDRHADEVYKKKVQLMPGVKKTLDMLSDRGVVMAIASSSPRRWIDLVVARFGLEKYFQDLFSTQTMGLPGKPDPAVYLQCMAKLGHSGKNVVVFEDSFVGMMAAKKSGAFTIALPDKRWEGIDFSAADCVFDSMEMVTSELLFS